MSAFAGFVAFDAEPSSKRLEERLRGAVAATGRVGVMRSNGALFVQRMEDYRMGGFAGPATPDRVLFAASARLDNREELAGALQITPSQLADTGDDVLLMRAMDRWGDKGVARCLGAFAFAHWNPADRRLTLGRDCIGHRSLFFYRTRDFVACASTLTILLKLPEVPRNIDETVLADYLAHNRGEARRTVYRGIERAPSRTLVTIDPAGVSHRHYWSPNLGGSPAYRRADDYIERARELFDQAVMAATRQMPRVAIATSGGLDSSAVAATVARQGRAERITCYTVVPAAGTEITVAPNRYLDERPKLEALGRMYPALDLRFLAPETPHPLIESDRHYFAASSVPSLTQTNLGLFGFLDDAAMAAGHRRLLAGYGGNFGVNWKGGFSLVTLLRNGKLFKFSREFAALAQQNDVGLARTFIRDVLMPGAPMRLRRWIYRLRGRDPYSIARFSALNPDFVADHGLIAKWRRNSFDPRDFMPFADPFRHRAYHLFDHNQIGRDRMGSLAYERGIEHVDPHSDRRLLEFALAIPEPMFRQNGVPRSFGRAVFSDRLPSEILNERRDGVQDANWFRRLDVRRPALAADIERLEGSATARRLIDLPRLKRILDQWPADEHEAEARGRLEFVAALNRAVHVGNFVRWVEAGNM